MKPEKKINIKSNIHVNYSGLTNEMQLGNPSSNKDFSHSPAR